MTARSMFIVAAGLAWALAAAVLPASAQDGLTPAPLGRPAPAPAAASALPDAAHAVETPADMAADTRTDKPAAARGLAGWLVATPDADWREKWDTPEETVPQFRQASSVARGQQLFVLTFFANPAQSDGGRVNLRCDLQILRPDGSAASNETDLVCFDGTLRGKPGTMYLALPVVAMSGDPDDPLGTWTVRVLLKDKVGNTELPLQTSFELK